MVNLRKLEPWLTVGKAKNNKLPFLRVPQRLTGWPYEVYLQVRGYVFKWGLLLTTELMESLDSSAEGSVPFPSPPS